MTFPHNGAPIGVTANRLSGSYLSGMAAEALSRRRRWSFSMRSFLYTLFALFIGCGPWFTFLVQKPPLQHTVGDYAWPAVFALGGAYIVWRLLTGRERFGSPVLDLIMVLALVSRTPDMEPVPDR